MSNRPIGLFDSGIGGLTILERLKKVLPNEHYIYIADQAHLPYGNKSAQQVQEFATKIMNYFIKRNVKLVLIPCNTATVLTLKFLQDHYKVAVIGVVEPTINAFLESGKENVVVIATNATTDQMIYEDHLLEHNPHLNVQSIATQRFVEMVENNDFSDFTKYCDLYFSSVEKFDSMILGCTHFPLVKSYLQKYFKYPIYFQDSIEPMVNEARAYLEKHDLLNKNKNSNGIVEVYTTSKQEGALNLAQEIIDIDFVPKYIEL